MSASSSPRKWIISLNMIGPINWQISWMSLSMAAHKNGKPKARAILLKILGLEWHQIQRTTSFLLSVPNLQKPCRRCFSTGQQYYSINQSNHCYESKGRSSGSSALLLPNFSNGFNHENKILEKKLACSSKEGGGNLQVSSLSHPNFFSVFIPSIGLDIYAIVIILPNNTK